MVTAVILNLVTVMDVKIWAVIVFAQVSYGMIWDIIQLYMAIQYIDKLFLVYRSKMAILP